ncbi:MULTISPECIES: phosphoketolase family protein [Streptomyces]|uniref:Probable phosphoketolase n=3 Tax=Streptomyces diastaticus group TaxID=2849069 RepID=A0A8H9LNC2_9ACTN|nr:MULTISPECIES: phosphoketolase family protein [Streptomyces]MDQ0296468.1 xylulose-5-phosphate/fructose-6-phosphate phosphoketolase [Streptomyces sp. DSM 41037]QNE83725.1 phosphoketolase [Streptomyces rutgersensis]WPR53763.1 phosphoketolase family protein [Streptomyces sp. S399]WSU35170.1 phosphoketolase family protein [Streptomyces gougerotii]GFH73924.1 putative phosphoketolase [Streptomyces diastaticus subsp. diastaticus]
MSEAPDRTGGAQRPAGPSTEEIAALDAHWRAANYLAVGQIYLMDNPLLARPLTPEDIKPRLLGHWGTSPGLNLVYTHLNRVIKDRDLTALAVWGPGHGGPAIVANSWLEGSWSDIYRDTPRDADGMGRLFKQFSFPGGIPSHVAPDVPGSIHEGGELGYALTHAYGAAFDHPGLLVACVIGDGEAETGPLAASWHSDKFLDPVHDGAVLPILHLNGYKIANPTVLARLPEDELDALLRGYGHDPLYVEGDDPATVHRDLAVALDTALDRIAVIQERARGQGAVERPSWPMIVLRTPKGWTGPREVDGLPVENTWRSHQVPLPGVRENAGHRRQLEEWMRSYRPEELFDEDGRPRPEVLRYVPDGDARLGATPYANGGRLTRDLPLPALDGHAVDVAAPGRSSSEPTQVLGGWLEAVLTATADQRDFRLVGPDETASNRLDAVYGATGKTWEEKTLPTDEHLSRDGRVMEVLAEHLCQGWLEGYLLTGRHGLFSCYEAFAHIVDSMVNQHIKWLRASRRLDWRRPVASLNYLLTSHVWRQDHNGFSHQDPGFVDHILNKSPEAVRVYLPPDANTLLAVAGHVLASRDYVNVVVAGKQPTFDWLTLEQARAHCARGAGVWAWAGTEDGTREPDVVLACAGDVPTQEVLAAAKLLRRHLPELSVRVVNVVDVARLMPRGEHPHGMPDAEYDALFTRDKPVVFAYHGYPWLIHRLAYRRHGHGNLHVRGYKEEGTTTTPFDMVVRNDLDRYRLVMDVIDRVPGIGVRAVGLRQAMADTRFRHHHWVREHGRDLPEVAEWSWEG